MIGANAVVWAISVAVYQFIYDYFDRRYGGDARAMAGWDGNRGPFPRPQVDRMLWRLRDNELTFRRTLTGGRVAVVSIAVSVLVLVFRAETLVALAVLVFLGSIGWFLCLFTSEIETSVRQMHELDRDIRSRFPPSPPPPSE